MPNPETDLSKYGDIEDPVETHLLAIYQICVGDIPPDLRDEQIEAFRDRFEQAALAVQNRTGYPTYNAFNFHAEVRPEEPISCGRFTYHPDGHFVESPYYPSQRIKLTPNEERFVRIAFTNCGRIVPYQIMFNFVYGVGGKNFRALNAHAAHIRGKIGDKEEFTGHCGPLHLKAINETGYLFQDNIAS